MSNHDQAFDHDAWRQASRLAYAISFGMGALDAPRRSIEEDLDRMWDELVGLVGEGWAKRILRESTRELHAALDAPQPAAPECDPVA